MLKKSKLRIAILITLALTVVLNIIAFSKSFCDFYKAKIYPGINRVVGQLTSHTSFAIGEIIMYICAILILALIVVSILFIFLHRKKSYRTFSITYYRICVLILSIFLLIYTLNWFIPIRSNVLKVSDTTKTEYTITELETLYRQLTNNINKLAEEVDRDEKGRLISDFTQDEIIEAMKSNSYRYPLLSGNYNKAKPAMCSDILDFMGIGGYNYIYTMEPTYNIYCNNMHMPVIICHEICHNKGYYLENEAEFLSSVILAESDSKFLQYCGLLEMYGYVENDFYNQFLQIKLSEGTTLVEEYKALCAQCGIQADLSFPREFMAALLFSYTFPHLSDIVYDDLSNSYEESVEFYEENVNEFLVENTQETFKDISDKGWEIQGELLNEYSYEGITLYLLQYYIG